MDDYRDLEDHAIQTIKGVVNDQRCDSGIKLNRINGATRAVIAVRRAVSKAHNTLSKINNEDFDQELNDGLKHGQLS